MPQIYLLLSIMSSADGLSSIFSAGNLEKFKRINRPVEKSDNAPQRKKRREGDGDADEIPKKKKPKHSKRDKVREIDAENDNDKAVNGVSTDTIDSQKIEEPDAEKNTRTLFVGNVPISETSKALKQMFKDFGEIESIRLRSVPYEGTAVDDKGNQDLVRKVSVNKGKLGSQKGSLNAYIVFSEPSAVDKALVLNNKLVGDRHIRVDKSVPTLFDPKMSVFLGGIPYYADEEKLREHFAAVSNRYCI